MATVVGSLHVQIRVRRKPLLYVAHVLRWADAGRGGLMHRIGNRLLDQCIIVARFE